MTSNNRVDLQNMSVLDLLSRYRQAAEGTSNRVPAIANKWHDAMHIYYKHLRRTSAGRAAIARLLDDDSPHVRCWAASHSLAWVPDQAVTTLKALRDAKGPCSFDAEITLGEYEKGRLSFEY